MFRRFMKAIAPALLSLVGVVAYSLINGKFDKTSIVIGVVGLVGAAVTFFVPNAQPEVQALEDVFAAPASFAPVSALSPEQPPAGTPAAAPGPVGPVPPTPPAAA